MNTDLISRREIKDHIGELILVYSGEELTNVILNAIDNAPTIPLPEFKDGYKQAIIDGKTNFSRPQGEWIDDGQYAEYHSEHAYRCKNCGYQIIESPNKIFENRFCKHCGADMKGGTK